MVQTQWTSQQQTTTRSRRRWWRTTTNIHKGHGTRSHQQFV